MTSILSEHFLQLALESVLGRLKLSASFKPGLKYLYPWKLQPYQRHDMTNRRMKQRPTAKQSDDIGSLLSSFLDLISTLNSEFSKI